VLSKYKVDFAILNHRKELLLVEIERPSIPLVKSNGGIHSQLQHALDQVRSWLAVFDDHRAAALYCFDLKLEEVAKVKGVVIAGRSPNDSENLRALRAASWGDIEVYIYDDRLKGVTDVVRKLANT
jgi:hypothetical protein